MALTREGPARRAGTQSHQSAQGTRGPSEAAWQAAAFPKRQTSRNTGWAGAGGASLCRCPEALRGLRSGLEGGGATSSVQMSGALLPGLQSTQGEGCPHHPTPRPGPQALAAAMPILSGWGLYRPGASLSCPYSAA